MPPAQGLTLRGVTAIGQDQTRRSQDAPGALQADRLSRRDLRHGGVFINLDIIRHGPGEPSDKGRRLNQHGTRRMHTAPVVV
jgi:hypothetical protein